MAENIIIFRPSADIQLQHTVFPSGLTAGYLAINDIESDGVSTFISGGSDDKSVFQFYGEYPSNIINVLNGLIFLDFTEADMLSDALRGEVYVELYVDGVVLSEYYSEVYSYPSVIEVSNGDIQKINEYILLNKKMPDIWLSVRFDVEVQSNESGKGGGGETGLTKMQVQLGYQQKFGIFQKMNNSYKHAIHSYKKIDGAWSEISSDETQTIIINNTIRRG